MKKRTIVFVASKDPSIDSRIVGSIRKYHGKETKIRHIRSLKVFASPSAFVALIDQTRNIGPAYVIEQDIERDCLTFAADRGRTFGVISGNTAEPKWFNVQGRYLVSPLDISPTMARIIFAPTRRTPRTTVSAAS